MDTEEAKPWVPCLQLGWCQFELLLSARLGDVMGVPELTARRALFRCSYGSVSMEVFFLPVLQKSHG